MNHLRLRTEYSFRRAFGRIRDVLEVAGGPVAAITDNGTWGHVPFWKAATDMGIKPILGVEILCVKDASERERQPGPRMAFLARNHEGLRELYELVTWSHEVGFYYVPRVDYDRVCKVSRDVVIITGNGTDLDYMPTDDHIFLTYTPGARVWNRKAQAQTRWARVVTCDNYYPRPDDRQAYEIISRAGRSHQTRASGIQHIPTADELRLEIPEDPEAWDNVERLVEAFTLDSLPRAEMVKRTWPATLVEMCEAGKDRRGGLRERWGDEYQSRLERELGMIEEKDFEDYFYVIADMVNRAKETMLVGPARGSAAGSLVCYLLGITDVDPIAHGLMFERFIDVTRADLPDIDIDFPDTKREQVIAQLSEVYGEERVGRIGTVARYKARSSLDEVARELSIPKWEIDDLKDAIMDRSGGDARAQQTVMDALDTLDIGKAVLEKYPNLRLAAKLEGHARNSGTHAAGVLVIDDEMINYCAIDKGGAAMIDKHDAEDLNMLKIDALGLRTLSVLEDTLEQIGKDTDWLVEYPLDDEEAFEVLNADRFSGIFQFEGYALQSLTRQMKIHKFEDIVAITALARPGPLHSGAASDFVACRTGEKDPKPLHPAIQHIVSETFGLVIYQEQVMAIGRDMGRLSWEDVNALRRAMSKSLGDEWFNQYWEKFREGAEAQGIPASEARPVWDHINTFGSWAFNKSHAVSYGLISYWCAVLKAHHPLEFGAATLRNAKGEDQAIKVLRDLVEEGYQYTAVDPYHSTETWRVHEGRLIGGLQNIKGIGPAKAADIMRRRAEGKPLTPGLIKLLHNPETPYDDVFEARNRFGDMYENPEDYKIESGGVSHIGDLEEAGEYVVIGKIKKKNLRDLNEYDKLAARGGRVIKRNNLFLNLTIEDDTGSIIAQVSRYDYARWGKPIVEEGVEGESWYLFKGKLSEGWRILRIKKWRKLA